MIGLPESSRHMLGLHSQIVDDQFGLIEALLREAARRDVPDPVVVLVDPAERRGRDVAVALFGLAAVAELLADPGRGPGAAPPGWAGPRHRAVAALAQHFPVTAAELSISIQTCPHVVVSAAGAATIQLILPGPGGLSGAPRRRSPGPTDRPRRRRRPR